MENIVLSFGDFSFCVVRQRKSLLEIQNSWDRKILLLAKH